MPPASVLALAMLLSLDRVRADALPGRIDQAIRAATPGYDAKAAKLADDTEFLRRVSLDLTGIVPSAA